MYTSEIFDEMIPTMQTSIKTQDRTMDEKYQIWIGTSSDGTEWLTLIPSSFSGIIEDEADELLREFEAHSEEEAKKSFKEWKESRWDEDFS